MKVLHVAMDVNPVHGGPPRSIAGLCRAEAEAGIDVTLFIHGPTGCETADLGKCKLIKGSGLSIDGHWRADIANALDSVKPDIVHQHAMWCLPLHIDDVECRRRGIPYIIAPRGSLEPWSLQQARWKKKMARWLYQDRDLHKAAALHATAQSEAEQLKGLGFSNPIIVSPNGVSLPERSWIRNDRKNGNRVLFLSRMHPKKGVLELVEAWKQAGGRGRICELVYTINSDLEREYERRVKARVRELKLDSQFIFTAALDDTAKWDAYARADLFVLPTYSENFGIAVAEALWAGLPVITTKGAPWGELESERCGWWIDFPLEETLASTLNAAFSECKSFAEMGARGHLLVERKYTWSVVSRAMVAGYERVLASQQQRHETF